MNTRTDRAGRALWAGLVAAMLAGTAHAQSTAQPGTLVTGKNITLPPLGTQTPVGNEPMNMIATPDGRYALVSDMGYHQLLSVLDTTTGKTISSLEFGNPATRSQPGLFYGLAVAPAAGGYTIYASQGNNHTVAVLSLTSGGALTQNGAIVLPYGDFPAGLALDSRGYLSVAVSQSYTGGTLADATTPSSLVIYNTNNPAIVTPGAPRPTSSAPGTPAPETARFYFGTLGTASNANDPGTRSTTTPGDPPNYVYSVAVTGTQVYVSSERDNVVYVFNTSTPAAPSLTTTIVLPNSTTPVPNTQAHPDSLLLSADGSKLYVAYAHADAVAVVNTASNAISSVIPLQLPGATALPGTTPTGLALSSDGGTLYVSLGDANAVGVVSLAAGKVTGFIPAGWYPSAVLAAPYRHLLVANAKGTSTRNPNPTFQYQGGNGDPNYGEYLVSGNVSFLSLPTAVQQAQDTQQVLANNRVSTIATHPAVFDQIGLKAAGITHVIYIVKENRTYDQVLGDEPAGNGNPALALFGRGVTPNQHALAERFVLLDNFYDCGEVSGDGWPWSTQGIANEFVIRNVPANYSGGPRRANYDFEGQNNNYPVGGFPATDPYGQPLVASTSPFAAGGPAIPDVGEAPGRDGQSGGHIWDNVRDAGLTYRNYGMYMIYGFATLTYKDKNGNYLTDGNGNFTYTTTPGLLPENYPNSPALSPAGHDRGGITDVDFRAYDNDFPDSDAPITYYNQTKDARYLYPKTVFGHYNTPSRFAEFQREFAEFQQADPTLASYPNFTTIRFNHDHTNALSSGTHSPEAEVADNDYACGQLVDLISHSPIWQSSAIFIVEDDSQAGPDHVDCHRSTCYVASPWIPKGSVDHTFYNTDSVLHTIELLLGLNPMSQYDAVATPILDFASSARSDAFTATLPPANVIGDLNPSLFVLKPSDPRYKLVAMSDKMDFTHADKAPAQLVNEILWKSIKGTSAKMPAPRHTLTEAQLYFGLQPPAAHLTAVKGKAGAKAVVRDSDD